MLCEHAMLCLWGALVVLFVCGASWGPGTHLWGAFRVIEHFSSHRRPPEGAALLSAHRDPFLYGTIAADLISFKRFGGLKNSCHNWNMRYRMEPFLTTPEARAFALGYLCHLAADIGSHNFFVPYHRVAELPPRVFGHTYWESSVDVVLGKPYWPLIEELRQRSSLQQLDSIIDEAVHVKALSMGSNRLIFHALVLAQSKPAWRRASTLLARGKAQAAVNEELLSLLREKMVRDMVLVVRNDSWHALAPQDPLGRIALRAARILRRQLVLQYGNREAALPVARRLARDCFWPPEQPGTSR